MENLIPAVKREFFHINGFVKINQLLSPEEVDRYRKIYDDFLTGKIDTGENRSDLGEGLGDGKEVENITQIMWPSKFSPELMDMPFHQRATAFAKVLLGNDMEIDFDMMINKGPGTNAITPWHQDEAYWLNLPDKRAVSCWLALDPSTLDNGCMWFVPKSHQKPVRPHRYAAKEGAALACDAQESEGVAVELSPGSCTFHDGRTLHYSRGNVTDKNRRALIINFRPVEMIQLERAKGFDHGRNDSSRRRLQNKDFKK